jgi:hypothetical protein
MGKKTARFNVKGAEFGWSGKKGGRTVEFEFRDDNKKIGTLQISGAAIKWKKARARSWEYDISVDKLNDLFEAFRPAKKS